MNQKQQIYDCKLLKHRMRTAQAQRAEAEWEAVNAEYRTTDVEEDLRHNRLRRLQEMDDTKERKRLEKEQQRPSRALWPEVFWEAHKEKWACEHSGVVAYGDSPEIACENFDQLWMFGHGTTGTV